MTHRCVFRSFSCHSTIRSNKEVTHCRSNVRRSTKATFWDMYGYEEPAKRREGAAASS